MARHHTRIKADIRELAARRGISYQQARALYTTGPNPTADAPSFAAAAAPPATGLEGLLAGEVDGWCAEQVYNSVEELPELAGALDDLEWHPEIEEPSVHELAPDLALFDVLVAETHDGGARTVTGSFAATLKVEGFLPRTEANLAADSGRVHVLDADFNERYLEVLDNGEGRVEFDFTAVVDTAAQTVEGFDVIDARVIGWLG